VVIGLFEIWWLEICYAGKLYEYRNNMHPLAVNRWSYARVSYKCKGGLRKQLVAGAVFLGSPIERGTPEEEDVFRPEWGCGQYARAYPVLCVRVFKKAFDLGYVQVLAGNGFSGIPIRNWLSGLVLHANRSLSLCLTLLPLIVDG
jgi:hypothetical protein